MNKEQLLMLIGAQTVQIAELRLQLEQALTALTAKNVPNKVE